MRWLLLLFIVNAAAAQNTTIEKLKLPLDTVVVMNGQKIRLSKPQGANHLINVERIIDTTSATKMPNTLQGFKDNQTKIGNNGKGFDVYQSSVDKMPVLKPDAQNLATLTYMIKKQPLQCDTENIQTVEEIPLQNFKYIKPLSDKEKKLLQLFKTK